MADKVRFELVSPEKLLLAEDVEMVVVPGGDGNFGVLPGHALLISTVRPGIIDVYEAGKVTERIFVSGGFAEVTPERCTVLADEALPLESLDRGEIEESLKSVAANITGAMERLQRAQGVERDQLLAELQRLEVARALALAKRSAIESVGAAVH
jgi:F-type H+-transporting ATPase subunit epsilon